MIRTAVITIKAILSTTRAIKVIIITIFIIIIIIVIIILIIEINK